MAGIEHVESIRIWRICRSWYCGRPRILLLSISVAFWILPSPCAPPLHTSSENRYPFYHQQTAGRHISIHGSTSRSRLVSHQKLRLPPSLSSPEWRVLGIRHHCRREIGPPRMTSITGWTAGWRRLTPKACPPNPPRRSPLTSISPPKEPWTVVMTSL